MKVLCIDNSDPLQPHLLKEEDWIFEGEIYTVIFEMVKDDKLFYVLSERYSPERSPVYQAKRFILLSRWDSPAEEEKEEVEKHLADLQN